MSEEVIVLVGVKQTITALRNFDKDAVRKFNKVVNTELSKSLNEAKALVPDLPPMSGWQVKASANVRKDKAHGGGRSAQSRGGSGWAEWSGSTVKAGLSKSRAEGKVRGDYTTNMGAIYTKSAAGKIFDGAGYSNKDKRVTTNDSAGSGNQFKRTLSSRFGKASRVGWKVVYKNKAESMRAVAHALEEAKADLQRALNAQNPWSTK
jgi:hypothetical protein